MARRIFGYLLWGAVVALIAYFLALGFSVFSGGEKVSPAARSVSSSAPQLAAQSWANPATLPDHFARHGADFGARNAEEYAALAAQLLQRAKRAGLPAKVDGGGTVRVYDPGSGEFGAYNSAGQTKTFFKPGSSGYFFRQPGRTVDLRTWN